MQPKERMTPARKRNLESVRDTGQQAPGSGAAYNCRALNWSEFVFEMSDGTTATHTEVRSMDRLLSATPWPNQIIGETLTDAGARALDLATQD